MIQGEKIYAELWAIKNAVARWSAYTGIDLARQVHDFGTHI